MIDHHIVAGIILASGMSRRFGARNKLLAPIDGVSMLERTIRAFSAAPLHPIHVVVGHDADAMHSAVSSLPVTVVWNPEYRDGQSRALRRGILSLPAETRAVLIGVADQPFLTARLVQDLIAAFLAHDAVIAVPRFAGRQGNPVLFARPLFPELLQVNGDRGGRDIIARHAESVTWIEVKDRDVGLDIDTDEEYMRLTQRASDRC
ncbi:MAG: hypothetical protein NVS2B16_09570 [Chloroflexota bacterium]